MKRMELIAPCHFGMEAVLKNEIIDLIKSKIKFQFNKIYNIEL